MAKVRRSGPLPEGSWDLEELGVVQHTSRWGTVARAKGSTLRYYPGCPWEKPPKPPHFIPDWIVIPSLVVRSYEGWYFEFFAYIAVRQPSWDYVLFTYTCASCFHFGNMTQYSLSLDFLGLHEGWLLWRLHFSTDYCNERDFSTTRQLAVAAPGCPRGTPPPGYFTYEARADSRTTTYMGAMDGGIFLKDCGLVVEDPTPALIHAPFDFSNACF